MTALRWRDLPPAVRRALAIRGHISTLVDSCCVVMGVVTDAAHVVDALVVAVDIDPRADVQIVLRAGSCHRQWWHDHCAFVPGAWESMSDAERAHEVSVWTTADERAGLERDIAAILAALADCDAEQN